MSTANLPFDGHTPTWCPGCGNWGIKVGIKSAFEKLGLDPSTLFLSFDIGCSGNMNDFLNGYASHGLHGRSVATAVGMKLANHTMTTVAIGGDGGIYGEGGNHFLHACRGNHDITTIVHDNMVYGLTTGQAAPTVEKGYKSKSTPFGTIELPVNPLALAISQGATFVAQSFAGDVQLTVQLLQAAVKHTGFSLVNILQPCVTFNKVNTYQYYFEHIYKLGSDYNPADQVAAMGKALELNQEKFPLGIIYQTRRPAYHEGIAQLDAQVSLVNRARFTNFAELAESFE